MGILDRARALLWPDRCILCGGVVAYGEDCCRRCREQGLLLREPERRMGLEVAAVWPYRAAAGAVRRFKFQGDMETGRKLARRMAWAWRRQRPGFAADCITFVPMPEERLRRRGYNQAELLARWVGERLELPVVPLLGRVGEQTQHELSAALRRQAAAHSFLLPPENEEKVRGRRVILVDDVVTTGSTAAACAGLLLEAGALEVAVLAAAR